MADSTTQGAQAAATTGTTSNASLAQRMLNWIERTPIDEFLFWIAVIIGLESKFGRHIVAELRQLAGAAWTEIVDDWQAIWPHVRFLFFLYFGIMIGLLLIYIIAAATGSKPTASFFLFALATWATIALAVFTFGAARKDQPENLRVRLLASYHRFMGRINTVAFLVISLLFLGFYTPKGAMPVEIKYGVMTVIVMATIYGIIRNFKVIYGLTALLFISAALIATQVIFTPAQVNTYLVQRVTNDDLVKITLTKDAPHYNAQGQTIGVVPKGTLVYANFNVPTWSIQGGGKAVSCTIGRPGGNIRHLYLKKGDNY